MKDKRFAKTLIVIFFGIAILLLLFSNFNSKLNKLLNETEIQCNEEQEVCYADLKRNVFFSANARAVIIYTGILTLFTLNIGAYLITSFYVSDNNEVDTNTVIKKKDTIHIKNIKKVKKSKKK